MQADANILHLVNVAKIIICGENGTRPWNQPNRGWNAILPVHLLMWLYSNTYRKKTWPSSDSEEKSHKLIISEPVSWNSCTGLC